MFIDAICAPYIKRDLYGNGSNNKKATRKQRQCPYRLMNILFSDDFAADFGCIGDTATRAELDSGDARNNRAFWVRVQDAFKDHHPIYDKMQFPEDKNLQPSINPGDNIQPHPSWKKLRGIWRDVNALYKEVLHQFTQSGTNESDFINFCDGKMPAYYLRQHLNLKPGLNETIRAGLPEHSSIDSEKPIPKPPPSSDKTKKAKSKRYDLVENLSDTINHLTYSLQNGGDEDKQMAQKHYKLLVKDNQRKDVKSAMFQYEKVMGMIKSNRKQFSNASGADYAAMLQEDFQNLKKRKRELGSRLGLS